MTFMKWQKYCGLHNYIMSRFTKTFLLSKKVPDDEGDETKRACLKKLGTNKVPFMMVHFMKLQASYMPKIEKILANSTS